MFGLFKSNPKAKIQKQINRLYEKALPLQRNGKLREYGQIMKEIDGLEKKKNSLG